MPKRGNLVTLTITRIQSYFGFLALPFRIQKNVSNPFYFLGLATNVIPTNVRRGFLLRASQIQLRSKMKEESLIRRRYEAKAFVQLDEVLRQRVDPTNAMIGGAKRQTRSQCGVLVKQLTKICWLLFAPPSTSDFLGKVGLKLAFYLGLRLLPVMVAVG